MSATAAKTTHSRELLVLQLVVGLFLVLRVYFDLTADLFGDEAYYWMWGQRLGWSYFDHPPLHAWLLGAVAVLAGWHPISVRLLTWLTLAGVLLIFRLWSRRVAPDQPALWFWRASAVYLASPMLFGMTMIAYNDHLLVFCSLLALHFFLSAGKSALIVTDEADKSSAITYLRDHFDTLTEVDSFQITRLGKPVYAWRIFRGDGLRP